MSGFLLARIIFIGTRVVPPFVLNDRPFVADSSDPLRRNRGRRGIEVPQRIQGMAGRRPRSAAQA